MWPSSFPVPFQDKFIWTEIAKLSLLTTHTPTHLPTNQPNRESYLYFTHPDSYFILLFLVENDNNYDNAIFYTGNIFLLWQGLIIQMLLLPMMMINNIKHINISKPQCLNHLHLTLITINYEPIKGLVTTIINYWLNHSFISPLR